MKRPLLFLLLLAGLTARAVLRAEEEPFDFETLRFHAKQLAAEPYRPRSNRCPSPSAASPTTSTGGSGSTRSRTWWRSDQLPFQLQFFHPGFVFDHTVQIHELVGRKARTIEFDAQPVHL